MGNYIPMRVRRAERRHTMPAVVPVPAPGSQPGGVPGIDPGEQARLERERLTQAERLSQLKSEKHERTIMRLTTRKQIETAHIVSANRIEEIARNATFPWEAVTHTIKMLEKSGMRSNRRYPFTAYAIFWGCRLVFGPSMDTIYAALSGIALGSKLKLLSSVTYPITLDLDRVQPIIEFLIAIAHRRKLFADNDESDESAYRAAAETCARLMIEHRRGHYERIQRGGEDAYGQTIVDLSPGWFRFEGRIPTFSPLPAGAVFYDNKRSRFVSADPDPRA